MYTIPKVFDEVPQFNEIVLVLLLLSYSLSIVVWLLSLLLLIWPRLASSSLFNCDLFLLKNRQLSMRYIYIYFSISLYLCTSCVFDRFLFKRVNVMGSPTETEAIIWAKSSSISDMRDSRDFWTVDRPLHVPLLDNVCVEDVVLTTLHDDTAIESDDES